MSRPVVVAGGGTGGHVFPMVAVAEALTRAGVPADELRYVGSRRGQERALLGSGAIALVQLPGRGVRRSVAPAALAANLGAVAGLVAAQVAALWLTLRWRPRAVVSLGGYAALAMDLAAVLLRRPLVLVDLDAHPSAVHRTLRRFATARCVAFDDHDPRATVTGTPLRPEIEAIDASNYVAPRNGQRFCVVVMTGSLGARAVNEAVVALADRWRARADVRIVHVTGRRDFEAITAIWHPQPDDQLVYELVPFAPMADLWPQCDLAICRAGAGTVAELAYCGIPSVLVPLPDAPGRHQHANASVLTAVDGAVVVEQSALTASHLAEVLEGLLAPDRLRTMSLAARSVGRGGAADHIASRTLAVAR